MKSKQWIAAIVVLTGIAACNYTVGDCWPVGQGDSTGDVGSGVINSTGPGNPGEGPTGQAQGALSGDQCNDPEQSSPGDSSGKTGGADAQTLMQDDLNDPTPAGGLTCNGPDDCLNKCNAEAKGCVAATSFHPYKPGMVGDLYQCIDRFPKAKYGGSYTCLYRYPNGDACIFAYAAKLGPIHLPAPPPLCVYKSQ